MRGLHIVWFRADLRVHDHAALRAAALATERDGGQVLPLICLGTSESRDEDMVGALHDLEHALAQRGAKLHYRAGDAAACLSELHAHHSILSLHMHVPRTKDADLQAVETWCLRAGVPLRLHQQYCPEETDWRAFMMAPRFEAPAEMPTANVGIGERPTSARAEDKLSGGRATAIKLLREVLGQVSDLSHIGDQNLQSGEAAFARLKPYLTRGVLSSREAWQAALSARQHYAKAGQDIQAARIGNLLACMESFARPQRASPPNTPRRVSVGRTDVQMVLDLGAPRAN